MAKLAITDHFVYHHITAGHKHKSRSPITTVYMFFAKLLRSWVEM